MIYGVLTSFGPIRSEKLGMTDLENLSPRLVVSVDICYRLDDLRSDIYDQRGEALEPRIEYSVLLEQPNCQ